MSDDEPLCPVCGKPIAPNAVGQYVPCCPTMPGPRRPPPVHGGFDRLLAPIDRWASAANAAFRSAPLLRSLFWMAVIWGLPVLLCFACFVWG